jgi:hypothetical protein
MTIYEDTKQKLGKHENIYEWCRKNGVHIERWPVRVGDYTLPIDQSVSIDTKYGLQEVYMDVIQDYERFKAEIIRARRLGIKLIFLVEEPGITSIYDVTEWKNPRLSRWKEIDAAHKQGKRLKVKISPFPPASSAKLARIMNTLSRKYGVEWQFCSKEQTGKKIIELLGGKP